MGALVLGVWFSGVTANPYSHRLAVPWIGRLVTVKWWKLSVWGFGWMHGPPFFLAWVLGRAGVHGAHTCLLEGRLDRKIFPRKQRYGRVCATSGTTTGRRTPEQAGVLQVPGQNGEGPKLPTTAGHVEGAIREADEEAEDGVCWVWA